MVRKDRSVGTAPVCPCIGNIRNVYGSRSDGTDFHEYGENGVFDDSETFSLHKIVSRDSMKILPKARWPLWSRQHGTTWPSARIAN